MRVVFCGPEFILDNQDFRDDIDALPAAGCRVDKIVIDEVHCVPHWGGDFRPLYKELGDLRAFVNVPMYATTATLQEHHQKEVQDTLLYDKDTTFIINLGNDRPNLKIVLRSMKGSLNSPMADFEEIIREAEQGYIRKRMVFVDDCSATQSLCNMLRKRLPGRVHQFAYYNSRIGAYTKKTRMAHFIDGSIRVLFATEAAGMVRTLCCVNVS
jgi:superfamily II DNA helicase RecQ